MTLESVKQVGEKLRARRFKLAVAESLTGGLLSARFTELAGSSDYFVGGLVCYQERIKESWVGVPAKLLREQGAVSQEVACAMAQGVRERLMADLGVAVTGVAGPSPHAGRPVGEVHLALASPEGVTHQGHTFSGSREEVREQTVQAAVRLVLDYLK